MTTQERMKILLPGVLLLFLAIAVSGAIFYYYHDKERTEAETTTDGTSVFVPFSPAPDAGASQPGSPAASLPDISPPGQHTDVPGDALGADDLSDSEQTTAPDNGMDSSADGTPPVEEAQPETPDAETPDKYAQAQPEIPSAPAEQRAAVQELEDNDSSHSGEAAPDSTKDSAETELSEEHSGSGVVLYGKGRPVTPDGHVVRGDIPAGQELASARLSPSGQDSIVSAAMVRDMAAFLAANYWPVGTHPMAQSRGISTVGVQWLNHRYGGQLHGFAVARDNPVAARERVLQYVFMPSMLRALHRLYSERFFAALRTEAAAQRRGPEESPLTMAQTAEMFGIYSGMAESLAGAVRAYADTPQIRSLVAAYARASTETAGAYAAFAESRERGDGSAVSKTSQAYQDTLKQREQAKAALAAAMRRGGAGQGIDAESLVYAAQWLYRRGAHTEATLNALAEILDASALHLATLQQEYLALPAGTRR